MPKKKASSKKSAAKVEKLAVRLSVPYEEGDPVIKTNHGRFVPDSKSKILLIINDGEQEIKAKPV